MEVKLTAKELTNAAGDVVKRACTLDLWGCGEFGVSTILEGHITRGSKHRTLENNVRRDITGTYRTYKIGYEFLKTSRYRKVLDMYQAQCDGLQCLELDITNPCADENCDCQGLVSDERLNVTMDINETGYSDNGGFVAGFEIILEESADCDECNNCN